MNISKRKPIVGISYKNYINSPNVMKEKVCNIVELTSELLNLELIVFPSMGTIESVADICKNTNLGYGVQNISPYKNGAYTGEYSIESIIELGGKYVEVGHYERRTIFAESHSMINKKLRLVLSENINAIYCIGEDKKCNSKYLYDLFKQQLYLELKDIASDSMIRNIIFAYEPGWAIGTKKSAEKNYIHNAHKIIREILSELYGNSVSQKVRIIYGGSVSNENVKDIISNENVDGVFVGRFGHDENKFVNIAINVNEYKNGGVDFGGDVTNLT